jgi:2',3'-cyclic-nucleotide 2'-phosphodiesterase (5'-nucleotidase family)
MRAPSLITALLSAWSMMLAWGLEFRDVNIFVVTDTHSWIDAHHHPDNVPSLDATYGNITSFILNIKKNAALVGKDVFFLDNGDVVDGTGYSTKFILFSYFTI